MIDLLRRNKNFRLLFFSMCISNIGDYIDDIAFSMMIYAVTGSTLITSYVFAIKMVLSFVSMFTASIVDYSNKKTILVFCSVGQGIVLFLLLMTYIFGQVSTITLIIFVTIQTLLSTFIVPAKNAIFPILVADEDLVVARASNMMFQQFIRIFSYVGSGTLIASMGIVGAIGFDIITFFIAGLLSLCIKYSEKADRQKRFNLLVNTKEGFKFIFESRIIVVIMILTFLGNMFTSPIDSLVAVYFSDFFEQTFVYSLFMAMMAIGGIIGTWLLTKIRDKYKMHVLLAMGFAFGGVGIMIMIFYSSTMYPLLAGFLYGISNGVVSVMNGVLIQINTPKEMTARVFSAFKCISYMASPLGIIVAGYLGEFISINKVFWGFGTLLTFTALIAFIFARNNIYAHSIKL